MVDPTPTDAQVDEFIGEEQQVEAASHALASAEEAVGAIAKVNLQRAFAYVHPEDRAEWRTKIMDGRQRFSSRFRTFKSEVGPAVDRGLGRLDGDDWRDITSVRDALQPLDFEKTASDAATIAHDAKTLEDNLKALEQLIKDNPYQPGITLSSVLVGLGTAIAAIGAAALALAAWPAFTAFVLGSAACCAVALAMGGAGLVAIGGSVALPELLKNKKLAKSALGTYIRGVVDFKEKFREIRRNLPEEPNRCPITQDEAKDPVQTPAGHVYERAAISEWVQRAGTDPLTRSRLTMEELTQDDTLADIAKRYQAAKLRIAALSDPENQRKQQEADEACEAQRERVRARLLRLKTNLERCEDSIDTINLTTELRVYKNETDGQLVFGALQDDQRPADLHDAIKRAAALQRVIEQPDAILGRLSRGVRPTDRFCIGDNIRGRSYRKRLKEELEYWGAKAQVQRRRGRPAGAVA